MTLKNDWAISEQFSNDDANDVANAVNAAYVLPGDGIPKADLVAAVQSSLDLADTALQDLPAAGWPYDLCLQVCSQNTVRVAGYGDFINGLMMQRPARFTSVTFRCTYADTAGNLVVELRKNGFACSGSSTTLAYGSQVAGVTTTGTWDFTTGDILTVYITSVGTNSNRGLIADLTGVTL